MANATVNVDVRLRAERVGVPPALLAELIGYACAYNYERDSPSVAAIAELLKLIAGDGLLDVLGHDDPELAFKNLLEGAREMAAALDLSRCGCPPPFAPAPMFTCSRCKGLEVAKRLGLLTRLTEEG